MLDVVPGTTHAGLVQFASSAAVVSGVASAGSTFFTDGIWCAKQTQGSTNIKAGIDVAAAALAESGRRRGTDTQKVIVVLTDGNPTTSGTGAAADRARDDGTVVMAVGIGSSVGTSTLRQIAGAVSGAAGSERRVLRVPSFEQVRFASQELASSIASEGCAPTPASSTAGATTTSPAIVVTGATTTARGQQRSTPSALRPATKSKLRPTRGPTHATPVIATRTVGTPAGTGTGMSKTKRACGGGGGGQDPPKCYGTSTDTVCTLAPSDCPAVCGTCSDDSGGSAMTRAGVAIPAVALALLSVVSAC